MRVLIADDSDLIRFKLTKQLIEWGYDVTAAADGKAAWEAVVGDSEIRIAIVDWHMPELDGPELCARIRALGEERFLYVVMLTSVSADEGLVTGMESGADHYLHKSSSLDQLAAHMKVARRIVELQLRAIEDGKRIARAEQYESIARLAGELAHELNTPFQYVASNLEFLQRELRGYSPEETGNDALTTTTPTTSSPRQELDGELLLCVNQSMEGVAQMARIVSALQLLAHASSPPSTPLRASAPPLTGEPGAENFAILNGQPLRRSRRPMSDPS